MNQPIQLTTIEFCKANSRILDDQEDMDLDFKISVASAILMNHMKWEDGVPDQYVENFSPITYAIPYEVQGACVLLTARLYEHREAGEPILTQAIKDLVKRVPTLR